MKGSSLPRRTSRGPLILRSLPILVVLGALVLLADVQPVDGTEVEVSLSSRTLSDKIRHSAHRGRKTGMPVEECQEKYVFVDLWRRKRLNAFIDTFCQLEGQPVKRVELWWSQMKSNLLEKGSQMVAVLGGKSRCTCQRVYHAYTLIHLENGMKVNVEKNDWMEISRYSPEPPQDQEEKFLMYSTDIQTPAGATPLTLGKLVYKTLEELASTRHSSLTRPLLSDLVSELTKKEIQSFVLKYHLFKNNCQLMASAICVAAIPYAKDPSLNLVQLQAAGVEGMRDKSLDTADPLSLRDTIYQIKQKADLPKHAKSFAATAAWMYTAISKLHRIRDLRAEGAVCSYDPTEMTIEGAAPLVSPAVSNDILPSAAPIDTVAGNRQ